MILPSIGISDFCFLIVESAAMRPVTKELDIKKLEPMPVPMSQCEFDLVFSMHDVACATPLPSSAIPDLWFFFGGESAVMEPVTNELHIEQVEPRSAKAASACVP